MNITKKSIPRKLNGQQRVLKRILDISYENKLSHISSCLTMSLLLYSVYHDKEVDDKVILSAGHSGLALYCILEHFSQQDALYLFKKHGVHPNRDILHGIHCSSGSLGHGIGIGLGMALANKSRDVHILSTDGEIAEGSWWESLRIADEQNLHNLFIHINCNGYSAYGKTDIESIEKSLNGWCINVRRNIIISKTECNIPCLKGLQGHYKVLSEEEYQQAINYI